MKYLLILVLLLTACTKKEDTKYVEYKYLLSFEGCKYYEIVISDQNKMFADCSKKIYNDKHEVELINA